MGDEQLTMAELTVAVLDDLAKWMRANGATRARLGDVELELGPVPSPVSSEPPDLSDAEAAGLMLRSKDARDAYLFASSEGFPEGFDE